MTRLVSLYPRDWRDRYEEEFLTLFAERPPTAGDRLDVVRGALDAHLHPQVPGSERVPDRTGIAALIGFVSLVVSGVLMANGPVMEDEFGTYREGVLALPFLVLATVLLSAALYRVVERLPARDPAGLPTLGQVGGWAAIIAAPTWSIMPWVAPLGLVFMLGVLGLAVAARRAGLWPAWSEVALVALAVLPAGILLAIPFLPWYAMRVAGLDFSVVLVPMSGVWIVVGAVLLRGSPGRGPSIA